MSANATFVYLWEFIVAPEHIDAFELAYGESGDWVRLFRRDSRYMGSELHRDCVQSGRYLTIDYWESEAAWRDFRSRFATEFEVLDERCAAWTVRETELGRFERVRDDDR